MATAEAALYWASHHHHHHTRMLQAERARVVQGAQENSAPPLQALHISFHRHHMEEKKKAKHKHSYGPSEKL